MLVFSVEHVHKLWILIIGISMFLQGNLVGTQSNGHSRILASDVG